MNKIRYYLSSFRPRTLPLSLSGVLLGVLLAKADGCFQWTTFCLAIATTLCLQILTNLANELGDMQKGTDNDSRLGPIRSIQSGALSVAEFKRTILVFVLLSIIFGSGLVYSSFDGLFNRDGLTMILLGAAAIVAAIKYTMGKNPYGYHGLGDLSVFLFFGLLSVIGSYFIMAHRIDYLLFLPASAIGLLSVGVLNLNNMRDMDNDRRCGKHTLPIILGIRHAKVYHFFLILGAWIFMSAYILLNYRTAANLIFLISLPLFVRHLALVNRLTNQSLDSQLKVLSLSTLSLALLSGLGAIM